MRRILITGSKGQLGTDLVEVLPKDYEVEGFDVTDPNHKLDITKLDQVKQVLESFKPDVVIHAAAMTDVDGCELNPDQAFLINALGTQNVALASQQTGATLVYISTDYVFDGKKIEPYTEFDQTNPPSIYGKSKLAGEEYVAALVKRHYIVRTSWLYGPGSAPACPPVGRERARQAGKKGTPLVMGQSNFIRAVLKLANEKPELNIVNDQIGSPTYSYDLAQKIAEIIETGWFGTCHITNQGWCSWYDLAKKILKLAGKEKVKVNPITTQELGRPAPRPAYSVLRNYCLELRGAELMRNYKEALKDYLSR